LAPGCATDCCRFGIDARAQSTKLQPRTEIPAVAPDKLFKNSLRVDMVPFLS
jgi:hypothetical protein